jgi:hypothetical protein
MSEQDDRDLSQWQAQWQGDVPRSDISDAEIRQYVRRRTRWLWSWMVGELITGVVAFPALIYLAVVAVSVVERLAMTGLALITVGALGFSWWNWRAVVRANSTSVAAFVAVSTERHRRLWRAWRVAWVVLAVEVVLLAIWIWDHLYSGARPHDASAERFAWGWLGGMTAAFVFGLIVLGRWIERDARRFEALRRELE